MEQKKSFKELIGQIKDGKNMEWIAIVLVAAIVISIYASTLTKEPVKNQEDILPKDQGELHWIEDNTSAETREEHRLKEVLSVIKGAGQVEVMITYSSGREIIPAMSNVESSTKTEEEDNSGGTRQTNQIDVNSQPITMNDSEGTKPIILKEVEPEIKGVIVISEGAEDLRVKMELMKAVQIALGINPNQVEVFVME